MAVTARAASIITVHVVAVGVAAQPVKVTSVFAAGVAVRVTSVPWS